MSGRVSPWNTGSQMAGTIYLAMLKHKILRKDFPDSPEEYLAIATLITNMKSAQTPGYLMP